MNSLRVEADNAVTRAEEAEAKNKKYEQALLEKDQEITSLQHRLGVLDAELEKAEAKVADSKAAQMEGEHSKMTSEGLTRKIQLLEEELDAAEKNVKETVEKCVSFYRTKGLVNRSIHRCRLRQVDVKAEHFERQVQRVEQERDAWEKKYEVRWRAFYCVSLLIPLQLRSNRKHKRSGGNLKQNWPTWKRACRICNCVNIFQRRYPHESSPCHLTSWMSLLVLLWI